MFNQMKLITRRGLGCLALLCILLCLTVACTGGQTADTETDVGTIETEQVTPATDAVTESETDSLTEAETETEPAGWAPETGPFNEGKVRYETGADGGVTAAPLEGYTLGLDITDRTGLVSICYSMWFDYILGEGTTPVTDWPTVTEVQAGRQTYAPSPSFHYWAKPAQGYYRSTDTNAIRNNMTMLYSAGVDFIILDYTNLHNGYLADPVMYRKMIGAPMTALLDTIMQMRAEGLGTPYVVVWCGDNDGALYRDMYTNYYAQEKWHDCFVYWDDKPFLLTTHTTPDAFPCKDLFTVRSMWGVSVHFEWGQWSFAAPNIVGRITYGADGTPEHVGITPSCQLEYMAKGTANEMSGANNATGRRGGKTWYVQWYYAFHVKPKILTLSFWNEWAAQRLDIGAGQYAFVDNFDPEYSRDLEPMEGGHGDQYYRWLIQYISAYKGNLECPLLVEAGEEEQAETMLRNVKRDLIKLGFLEG